MEHGAQQCPPATSLPVRKMWQTCCLTSLERITPSSRMARRSLPPQAEKIKNRYWQQYNITPGLDGLDMIMTDYWFKCAKEAIAASLVSSAGKRAFVYRFSHNLSIAASLWETEFGLPQCVRKARGLGGDPAPAEQRFPAACMQVHCVLCSCAKPSDWRCFLFEFRCATWRSCRLCLGTTGALGARTGRSRMKRSPTRCVLTSVAGFPLVTWFAALSFRLMSMSSQASFACRASAHSVCALANFGPWRFHRTQWSERGRTLRTQGTLTLRLACAVRGGASRCAALRRRFNNAS